MSTRIVVYNKKSGHLTLAQAKVGRFNSDGTFVEQIKDHIGQKVLKNIFRQDLFVALLSELEIEHSNLTK